LDWILGERLAILFSGQVLVRTLCYFSQQRSSSSITRFIRRFVDGTQAN
jgi:hypothetical protein